MSAFARAPGPSFWKPVPQTKTAAPSVVKAAAPGDAQWPGPSPTGWKLEAGPFPGWAKLPEW
jgi:hypothetical protein